MFSKREKYIAALNRQPVDDELVWAPNFDYWLTNNSARGAMPERYAGMCRNDIVRAVGASIWNRAGSMCRVLDSSVIERGSTDARGVYRHWYETPIGEIYEEYSPTENAHSSKALTKHFIASLDDLRVMKYVVEASAYHADFTATQRALEETRDDGIVLNHEFCVPFIQFAKTDAGYVNGIYMWVDNTREVEELLGAYMKQYVGMCALLRSSPADVIACNDNMDEVTVSPDIFQRYAMPFYQACKAELAGSGKLFEAHWCGRTPHLLPMAPETGLDVVEAVVTRPMADISLSDALDRLDGKVTLQGGIPAVYMCPGITTQHEFEVYMESTILPLRGRPGFVLGMSDNVPPDADFARVAQVAAIIKK